MNQAKKLCQGLAALALIWSATACVVAEPREGYYDRPHHRYYHERGWHECGPDDHYCR